MRFWGRSIWFRGWSIRFCGCGIAILLRCMTVRPWCWCVWPEWFLMIRLRRQMSKMLHISLGSCWLMHWFFMMVFWFGM